jgi:DNA repair protein RecO
MAIEKIKAFVLKTMPYRESSGIFSLLTQRHGVVHGIAKGIRKKKATASFLERGFLIETLLYVKPHRELHTLGDIHMLEYFPGIRGDLVKGAVRDAAFETILVNVALGFPCPDLFLIVKELSDALEKGKEWSIPLLWRFYRGFSAVLGVELGCHHCIECGKDLIGCESGFLVIEKGGFACEKCSTHKELKRCVPGAALLFCRESNAAGVSSTPPQLSNAQMRQITRLFASYCQHHGHGISEYKALDFLDSLL